MSYQATRGQIGRRKDSSFSFRGTSNPKIVDAVNNERMHRATLDRRSFFLRGRGGHLPHLRGCGGGASLHTQEGSERGCSNYGLFCYFQSEYKDAMLTGRWHRQIELPNGERVMLNSQFSMHHYNIQDPGDVSNMTAVSVRLRASLEIAWIIATIFLQKVELACTQIRRKDEERGKRKMT